jgi:photosystem II stability/assembly factor-like uncharacterized protein
MGKIFLFLFMSVFYIFPQQWVNQNVSFSSYNVKIIKSISSSINFFALGPELWRTMDGASSLVKIYETDEVNSYIGDIFYYEPFLLVSTKNKLLKSTNFGDSFIETSLPASGQIYFVSENSGWLRNSSQFFRTTNGGIGWTQTQLPTSAVGNMYFKDSLNGFFTTDVSGWQERVYKTTDGGSSWSYFNSGLDLRRGTISFFKNGIGFISGGNSSFLYTSDGGISWVQKTGMTVNYVKENIGFNIYQRYPNEKQAYITFDFGETWEQFFLPYNRNGAVFEAAEGSIFFSGYEKGAIHKSTDMGRKWICKTKDTQNLQWGFFLNENKGWITGDNLMRTSDGGNTWEFIFTKIPLGDLYFIDELKGFAEAGYVPMFGSSALLHTSDGGENWDTALFFENYWNKFQIYFTTTSKGFITGGQNLFGRTYDGGLNWDFSNPQNISGGLSFVDSLNGFISNYSNGFRTYDGGITWIEKPSLAGGYCFFLDTLNGWKSIYYSGQPLGYLLRTTDGGNSFFTIASGGHSYSVQFFNPLDGINFVGNHLVLTTSDGGYSWNSLFSAYLYNQYYFGSTFLSQNIGWVYGERGEIYKYTHNVPVEFSTFTTDMDNSTAVLKWSTATETNNRGFEIERKSGSESWSIRGFVKGAGTSTEIKDYTFLDIIDVTGKYFYRLKQVDFDGSFKYSEVVEVNYNITPAEFSLQQNYPNPFNPGTTITYLIPQQSFVKIKVYNTLGREVSILVNEEKTAGEYKVDFNADGLASGVYLYRIDAGDFSETRKMLLIK